MSHRHLIVTVLWVICSVAGTAIVAEDRITFRSPGAKRPVTIVGEIVEYTGRDLTLHSPNGIPQYIPAEDILEVKTHYDTTHLEGLAAYRAGRVGDAIPLFINAYDREPRDWVDREIAASIVRCCLIEDDWNTAILYFRKIIKSDALTRHWGGGPLIWSPRSLPKTLVQSVRALLVSADSGDRLLAASILLFDESSGQLAIRELQELASDPNPRVSRLARAQLWRVAIAKNEVTVNILQGWREQIQEMPEALRPGPQYMLGRGYALLGEQRLAAAEFLKLTILDSNHDALVARATLEAAEAIERTGLTQESHLLYRELLIRFPTSRESRIAREKISGSAK